MSQRAVLTLGGKVIADDPYTPASDYPRARIAKGRCPGCPAGRGITTGWNGTTELLDCDSCSHKWFRGHPCRQPALFEATAYHETRDGSRGSKKAGIPNITREGNADG